jgi:hypothetical protein
MDRGLSHLVETHCSMEGLGHEVWRLDIHLTDHSLMPSLFRNRKKVFVEKSGNPLATRRARDNDAIDLNK